MFYVRIDGISDEDLEFLGYQLVAESEEFKLYHDYQGDEHVVQKQHPYLYVDDINDAQILSAKSTRPWIVTAPPPTPEK